MDLLNDSVVLIVDDLQSNLEILGSLLRGKGFQVAVASNGPQAIRIACAKIPDLILLDISMPGMDGLEVCRILKQTPETFHIPVIFITAKSETEDIIKGFESGGVDYIVKPFKPAELLARVITHIELKKSREDIASRKIVESKLRSAKEKAEELSRLKSSLLANMSHEFRTPLIGIIGYSQLLMEELFDPDHKNMLLSINKSGQRLLTTLNSILSLSELESGKLKPNLENADLNQLIHPVLLVLEDIINEKDLILEVKTSKEPIPVKIDTIFFYPIIIYLVENAIKYTERGSIKVDVNKIKDKDGMTWGRISISDTGIGIDKDKQSLIFDEFRQASEGLSRNYEGTGLGLTLAGRLVALLKGKILIESNVGKGSTFLVEFPCC